MENNNLGISINHVFKAPPAEVYKLFSSEVHLREWWRIADLPINAVSQFDFTPKSSFHYSVISSDHIETHAMFAYEEISTPVKLHFRSMFCDKNGNQIRSPFQDNWPLEVLYQLQFVEDDGNTSVEAKLSIADMGNEDFEAVREDLLADLLKMFQRLETYSEELYQ